MVDSTEVDQLRGLAIRLIGTVRELRERLGEEDEVARDLQDAEESGAGIAALFEALQSSAVLGFACFDRDFRFLRVNDALAQVNRLAVEEHIGRSLSEVAPALWSQLQLPAWEVLDTGAPVVNVELVGTGSAGLIGRWVASLYPITIDAEIIGIGCLMIDMTARYEAEELTRMITETMVGGLYARDDEGRLSMLRLQPAGAAPVAAERELDALNSLSRTREALDEDRLVMYSQPIVPISGGSEREELLVRMISPGGEIVVPRDFLPAAEQYGLITEIDRWAITQGIEVAARGRRVQVNLSARSLGPRMLDHVESELERTGADPSLMTIELTETALMADVGAGQRFATELAAIGCGLALDDFGTGFASLSYLRVLPVQYLKIDIEFIRDLTSSETNQHLVRSIIALAQGLGLRTIAEGVEDAATLELLAGYGVDFAQGFHLGVPAAMTTVH